jgi:ABC-type antimicrobial peptide transport system permease subunit
MIVLHGMRLVVAGVLVGVGVAIASSRLIGTLLFGVSSTDVRTMAGVPAMLVAIAIVACLVPAQRAARLDPADILREG